MDGSGQQDRKALAAERDLRPIHQGTVQQGTQISHHLCEHHLTVNTNEPVIPILIYHPLADPHI